MPRDEKPSDTEKGKLQIQYFLIQVSKYGSESILRDSFYQHENWMDTHHDADHGNVRIGDILIIYFASNSIKFPQQIKKVYRVSSVSENNRRFYISEIKELNGITLQLIKSSIQYGKIRNEIFNKVGQQGFNIIKIEKSDFDRILFLDKINSSADTGDTSNIDQDEFDDSSLVIPERSINLEQLIECHDYKRDLTKEENILKQRVIFISQFSISKIQQMGIDEYVVGKLDLITGLPRKSTFCYNLERGLLSDYGGISGTPADKFGIYYDRNNQRYIFDNSKYTSPQEAFIALREDILSIIETGRQFHLTKNLNVLKSLDHKFNLHRHIVAKTHFFTFISFIFKSTITILF